MKSSKELVYNQFRAISQKSFLFRYFSFAKLYRSSYICRP
nr:MAG TPA: hypothetical protein [Caudoviricetes sp.]